MAKKPASNDMKLKKSTKILLGLVTIWPVAYMFLFFVGIIAMMVFLPAAGSKPPPQGGSPFIPIGFLGFFALHLLTMLLIMGLMAFYIVRVFKTPLEEAMKIMWTILICMFGAFAMPVFWYLYIWREAPALPRSNAELSPAPTSGFVNSTEWSRRENEYPPNPPDWR